MKLFGVVGWKNSGKTGLVERLVREFCERGMRVATIKHAHYNFEIDHAGTDSARHRAAGASQVLLASSRRWALMSELGDRPEPPLAELIKRLDPCDLLLVEGYKSERHAKIEAHRAENKQPLIAHDDMTVCAVASDVALTLDRPVFELDDTRTIADFILSTGAQDAGV